MNVLKNMFQSNLALKAVSLLFGFLFWIIFGMSNATTMTLDVPICFYNSQDTRTVDAPEAVRVTLGGKRNELYNLDLDNLALHLNTDEMKIGDNLIFIDEEKLFLPNNIKLVQWKPSNPIVTITE